MFIVTILSAFDLLNLLTFLRMLFPIIKHENDYEYLFKKIYLIIF